MTAPAPSPTHVVHHVGGNLGKMVGPLPLGAWVAVVGGGLAFVVYSKRKGTSAAIANAGTPTVTTTAPDSGAGGSGQWQDLTTPTTGTTATTAAVTTNDQWEVSAINYLIGHGYDPGLADSAIRKYVGGAKLSVSEYALVREALLRLGSPPQPLPAPLYDNPTIPSAPQAQTTLPKPPTSLQHPVTPHPPPKATLKPAPKPAVRRYTVVHGDTLWALATRYYHNPLEWRRIYDANRGVIGSNPNVIRPGEVLVIP